MSEGIKQDLHKTLSPMDIASAIVSQWIEHGSEDEEFDPLEAEPREMLTKMIAMSLVGAYDSGVADGNNRLEQRIASMNFTARSELVRILQDKWKQKDKSLYLTT